MANEVFHSNVDIKSLLILCINSLKISDTYKRRVNTFHVGVAEKSHQVAYVAFTSITCGSKKCACMRTIARKMHKNYFQNEKQVALGEN